MFNEYLHGYYIHGVHPLGQSEGSLQYIEETFDKEAKSKCDSMFSFWKKSRIQEWRHWSLPDLLSRLSSKNQSKFS